MLVLIGLGLGDEKDITVRGLELVKSAERVYLEAYTAVLGIDRGRLESFYDRPIIEADRLLVESWDNEILQGADTALVVLLVVGDPLAATTHTDLLQRAREANIPTQVSDCTNLFRLIPFVFCPYSLNFSSFIHSFCSYICISIGCTQCFYYECCSLLWSFLVLIWTNYIYSLF